MWMNTKLLYHNQVYVDEYSSTMNNQVYVDEYEIII